jgi:hypothetical protein
MQINVDVSYQNTENSKELNEKTQPGFIRSEYRNMIGDISHGQGQYILELESFGKAVDQVCEYYLSMGYKILSVTAYTI